MQISIYGYILNCSRFGNAQKTAVQILGLVPSITVSRKDANIGTISEMYSSDLLRLSMSSTIDERESGSQREANQTHFNLH